MKVKSNKLFHDSELRIFVPAGKEINITEKHGSDLVKAGIVSVVNTSKKEDKKEEPVLPKKGKTMTSKSTLKKK